MTTLSANYMFHTMPFTLRLEIDLEADNYAGVLPMGTVTLGKNSVNGLSISFYNQAHYGSKETTPEVNWSGCGSQSLATSAYYATGILLASQIAADPTGFLLGIVTGANQNVTDCQWYHGDAKSVLAALVAVLS